jgi:uncharacterized protein YbjT (DUF2867 family)
MGRSGKPYDGIGRLPDLLRSDLLKSPEINRKGQNKISSGSVDRQGFCISDRSVQMPVITYIDKNRLNFVYLGSGKEIFMGKKVIITGATGMVGKGVLLECLDHKEIDQVLVINRNPLDLNHPKLSEILHKDFSDFTLITDQLSGYDACFFCMGISSAGMKEEDYRHITYDYTMALADELFRLNPGMTFNYVSGTGTDSSEKGRIMWARVKGKTENDLLNKGFGQAYMFRPGAIIPLRGIKSRTRLYQFMYDYFLWLIKIFKGFFPNSIVNTTQIGLAMINSLLKGYDVKVLGAKDILILSRK